MESRRNWYIRTQVYDIAPRWSRDGIGIQFDEENCDWLIIPKYPLPDRWQQRNSPLLILFPEAYPDVPPTGFYLRAQLEGKWGADPHYFRRGYYDAPDLSDQGWWWYCLVARTDVEGGWEPSDDPYEADNLWTFLNMVREALSIDD